MVRGNARAIPRRGAAAGDSATVTITPRTAMLNYEAFMQLCYPTIRRIGRNAGEYYGRFNYSVSFNVTMRRPAEHQTRNHTHDEVTADLVLYPSRPNPIRNAGAIRQITRHSTDWMDEAMFTARIDFEDAFQDWSNANGSGFSLVSINFVEMHIVKTRLAVAAGGVYFKVPGVEFSCINVKNEDDLCFKWAIRCSQIPESIVFKGDPTPSQLAVHGLIPECFNWSGIQFPIEDYDEACDTFERNNSDMALHVWRWEEGDQPWCIRVSPREGVSNMKHIDLFLAHHPTEDRQHYLYIKSLQRFIAPGWPMAGVCRSCSIAFKHRAQHETHICDPATVTVPLEKVYPGREWSHGFNHLECRRPVLEYIVVHVATELIERDDVKHMQISELSYIRSWVESYNPDHPCNKRPPFMKWPHSHTEVVSWNDDTTPPVHWFMSQMQQYTTEDIPVVFRDTKIVHLVVGEMEDDDLQFNTMYHFKLNATNMSNVKFRNMRFVDTSNFYPSEATSAQQLYQEWEEFRAFSYRAYNLEPLRYMTAPSMAWDAALWYTRARPEYIQYDDDTQQRYEFANRCRRGPINLIPQRLCRANNELVEGYDASQPKIYLANFDIKSAYAWSMKQALPYDEYRMLQADELVKFTRSVLANLATTPVEVDDKGIEIGYMFDVDLDYPPNKYWQDRHSELPLTPAYHTNGKYACTFIPKKNYVVHYRLLSFYLKRGCILRKLHAGMRFRQAYWLHDFMVKQEQLRNDATSPMMNKVIKKMTNSVFGKTCYRPDDGHVSFLFNMAVEKDRRNFNNFIKPETDGLDMLSDRIMSISQVKRKAAYHQHVAVGMSILELGKLQLYQWWYDRLKPAHPAMELLYCDTDSLIVSMREDPQIFIRRYPHWFDGSVGSLKEESGGAPGVLFVGCKPKHYLYETSQDSKIRLSGLTRDAATGVTRETFMEVLDEDKEAEAEMDITYTDSLTHQITVERIYRKYLNSDDHTRYYSPGEKLKSLPFGHISIADMAE